MAQECAVQCVVTLEDFAAGSKQRATSGPCQPPPADAYQPCNHDRDGIHTCETETLPAIGSSEEDLLLQLAQMVGSESQVQPPVITGLAQAAQCVNPMGHAEGEVRTGPRMAEDHDMMQAVSQSDHAIPTPVERQGVMATAGEPQQQAPGQGILGHDRTPPAKGTPATQQLPSAAAGPGQAEGWPAQTEASQAAAARLAHPEAFATALPAGAAAPAAAAVQATTTGADTRPAPAAPHPPAAPVAAAAVITAAAPTAGMPAQAHTPLQARGTTRVPAAQPQAAVATAAPVEAALTPQPPDLRALQRFTAVPEDHEAPLLLFYHSTRQEIDDSLPHRQWLHELLRQVPGAMLCQRRPVEPEPRGRATQRPGTDPGDAQAGPGQTTRMAELYFHIPYRPAGPGQQQQQQQQQQQGLAERHGALDMLEDSECRVLVRTLMEADAERTMAIGGASVLAGVNSREMKGLDRSDGCGSQHNGWQILQHSWPLLPLPLVSLDLSGHEVNNMVIQELVACAHALGPDCRLRRLRLSGCQLDLAPPSALIGRVRDPKQRGPLWSLGLCFPLASRLEYLDLSHNPNLRWDEVQWMTLLASLCSLRCLDIRGSGLTEEGLQQLMGVLVDLPCASTLQALHVGPPSVRAGSLQYSYNSVSPGSGLDTVLQDLPHLQAVQVVGLTSDQVATLKEHCKQQFEAKQVRANDWVMTIPGRSPWTCDEEGQGGRSYGVMGWLPPDPQPALEVGDAAADSEDASEGEDPSATGGGGGYSGSHEGRLGLSGGGAGFGTWQGQGSKGARPHKVGRLSLGMGERPVDRVGDVGQERRLRPEPGRGQEVTGEGGGGVGGRGAQPKRKHTRQPWERHRDQLLFVSSDAHAAHATVPRGGRGAVASEGRQWNDVAEGWEGGGAIGDAAEARGRREHRQPAGPAVGKRRLSRDFQRESAGAGGARQRRMSTGVRDWEDGQGGTEEFGGAGDSPGGLPPRTKQARRTNHSRRTTGGTRPLRVEALPGGDGDPRGINLDDDGAPMNVDEDSEGDKLEGFVYSDDEIVYDTDYEEEMQRKREMKRERRRARKRLRQGAGGGASEHGGPGTAAGRGEIKAGKTGGGGWRGDSESGSEDGDSPIVGREQRSRPELDSGSDGTEDEGEDSDSDTAGSGGSSDEGGQHGPAHRSSGWLAGAGGVALSIDERNKKPEVNGLERLKAQRLASRPTQGPSPQPSAPASGSPTITAPGGGPTASTALPSRGSGFGAKPGRASGKRSEIAAEAEDLVEWGWDHGKDEAPPGFAYAMPSHGERRKRSNLDAAKVAALEQLARRRGAMAGDRGNAVSPGEGANTRPDGMTGAVLAAAAVRSAGVAGAAPADRTAAAGAPSPVGRGLRPAGNTSAPGSPAGTSPVWTRHGQDDAGQGLHISRKRGARLSTLLSPPQSPELPPPAGGRADGSAGEAEGAGAAGAGREGGRGAGREGVHEGAARGEGFEGGRGGLGDAPQQPSGAGAGQRQEERARRRGSRHGRQEEEGALNAAEQLALVRQQLADLNAQVQSLEADPMALMDPSLGSGLAQLMKKRQQLKRQEQLFRGLTPFGFDHALEEAPFNSQKLRPAQQTRQVRAPEKYSPEAVLSKKGRRRPQGAEDDWEQLPGPGNDGVDSGGDRDANGAAPRAAPPQAPGAVAVRRGLQDWSELESDSPRLASVAVSPQPAATTKGKGRRAVVLESPSTDGSQQARGGGDGPARRPGILESPLTSPGGSNEHRGSTAGGLGSPTASPRSVERLAGDATCMASEPSGPKGALGTKHADQRVREPHSGSPTHQHEVASPMPPGTSQSVGGEVDEPPGLQQVASEYQAATNSEAQIASQAIAAAAGISSDAPGLQGVRSQPDSLSNKGDKDNDASVGSLSVVEAAAVPLAPLPGEIEGLGGHASQQACTSSLPHASVPAQSAGPAATDDDTGAGQAPAPLPAGQAVAVETHAVPQEAYRPDQALLQPPSSPAAQPTGPGDSGLAGTLDMGQAEVCEQQQQSRPGQAVQVSFQPSLPRCDAGARDEAAAEGSGVPHARGGTASGSEYKGAPSGKTHPDGSGHRAGQVGLEHASSPDLPVEASGAEGRPTLELVAELEGSVPGTDAGPAPAHAGEVAGGQASKGADGLEGAAEQAPEGLQRPLEESPGCTDAGRSDAAATASTYIEAEQSGQPTAARTACAGLRPLLPDAAPLQSPAVRGLDTSLREPHLTASAPVPPCTATGVDCEGGEASVPVQGSTDAADSALPLQQSEAGTVCEERLGSAAVSRDQGTAGADLSPCRAGTVLSAEPPGGMGSRPAATPQGHPGEATLGAAAGQAKTGGSPAAAALVGEGSGLAAESGDRCGRGPTASSVCGKLDSVGMLPAIALASAVAPSSVPQATPSPGLQRSPVPGDDGATLTPMEQRATLSPDNVIPDSQPEDSIG